MLKDLVDDRLILDTGDYLGFASALWADRHIDIEYPFEALRPGHRLAALFWCLVILRLSWIALAPFGWRHINPVFAVGREYTMESSLCGDLHRRVRFTRGFGTSVASLATKSSGSKMTWVVPSL